jgi:acylglycerol lipase
VLHGIGFHGGPYKVIADSLNKRGISVYAVDARGHGLSCGKRDEIPGTPIENEDVHRMIGLLRQTYPNAKIFLLGESMGGIFALNYAQENRGDISGLILMAPAVSIAWKQIFRLGNLSLLPYILCPDKQAVSLIDRRLKESTRDDQFVIQRRTDPLAYKKVSINYVNGIHRSAKHWDTVAAPRIKIPTLILQGERDPIVNVKGSRRLFELLATSDKEFKAYKSVPHTLLWDPETPRVLESVGDWIVRH